MVHATNVIWLSLICYVMYRGYHVIRYTYPRFRIRSGDEQRLLIGFLIGFCLATSCAIAQLYLLSTPEHSTTFAATLTNVTVMLGGGPLLFLVLGMWKEVVTTRWLKKVYAEKRMYRTLSRIFYAWTALLLSFLFLRALFVICTSIGVLGLLNTLTGGVTALICLGLSAFFASAYYRRPCKMGKRIQVVLETHQSKRS